MHFEAGFYNRRKNPCVEISLAGAFRSKVSSGAKFQAVIDTGFEGMLSMPLKQALPIGLVLSAQIDVVLANGSVSGELVAVGYASVADRRRRVEVILQRNSTEVLIGLEFLRVFDLALVITSREVLLLEENEGLLDSLRASTASPGIREPPPPPWGRVHSRRH